MNALYLEMHGRKKKKIVFLSSEYSSQEINRLNYKG